MATVPVAGHGDEQAGQASRLPSLAQSVSAGFPAAAQKPPGSPCHPLPAPLPPARHRLRCPPREGGCTVASLCTGFLMRMGLSKAGPASHVFLPRLHPSINCHRLISPTRFPCSDALCLAIPTQEAFSQPGADNGLIYSPRLNTTYGFRVFPFGFLRQQRGCPIPGHLPHHGAVWLGQLTQHQSSVCQRDGANKGPPLLLVA